MSDTPRTDSRAEDGWPKQPIYVRIGFSGQLEIELDEANRLYRLAMATLNARDELQKNLEEELKNANRQAALYSKDTHMVMEQRDQWRQCAEEAVNALKEISFHKTKTEGLFRAFATHHVETIKGVIANFNKLKNSK